MKQEFNYYINLWTAIKDAGGCQVIDPMYESGEEGNDWFNNMVEAGMITIQVWDDTGAQKEWSDTSVATSTNNNYLQDMADDKELKKAEKEADAACVALLALPTSEKLQTALQNAEEKIK